MSSGLRSGVRVERRDSGRRGTLDVHGATSDWWFVQYDDGDGIVAFVHEAEIKALDAVTCLSEVVEGKTGA